jgi:hypothetical protein
VNNIYFIILAILSCFYVFHVIRKKKFSIKESFWWVIASIVMIILAIWPYAIDKIAGIFGIEYPPSLLFVLCIIFLLFICFRNSKIISEQQEKIIDLAQELAIVKEKVKDYKTK